MSHTPGPWRVSGTSEADTHGRDRHKIESATAEFWTVGFIAHVYDKRTPEEQRENARLIAAAPELLDKLRWLASMIDTSSGCPTFTADDHDAIECLIAKVTG